MSEKTGEKLRVQGKYREFYLHESVATLNTSQASAKCRTQNVSDNDEKLQALKFVRRKWVFGQTFSEF